MRRPGESKTTKEVATTWVAGRQSHEEAPQASCGLP
jgi:hypothetical protein